MYNGIGLQTPRGSGTNGYIQGNKFFVRPKTNRVTDTTKSFEPGQGTAGLSKKPNKDILEHDRKRQIHLKLAVLEDKLIDQGYTDAEIAEKLDEARETLEAAASSEEGGGPTAIVVAYDNKVSDTQTHQIAARKEKQMETFRAALGIGMTENELIDEGTDDGPRNNRKNGQDDHSKGHERREHAFLGRDIGLKKHTVEDPKSKKDDKKKGVKDIKSKKNEGGHDEFGEPRHHKKGESRKRRHDDDSSDIDSSREHSKGTQKKHRTRRQGNDSENGSDIDVGKKKGRITKKYSRSRRDDSDDCDSATDGDESDKYKTSHKGHDSDDDFGSDEGSPKHRTRKEKQLVRTRKRYDSEDESEDVERDLNRLRKHKKKAIERNRDSDSDAGSDGKLGMGRRRSRRHDTDDEDSDSSYDRKNNKMKDLRQKAVKREPASPTDDSDSNNSDGSYETTSDSDSGRSLSDYEQERIGKKSAMDDEKGGHRDDANKRGKQSNLHSPEEKGFRSSAVGSDRKKRERSHNNGDRLVTLRKSENNQSSRYSVDSSGYRSQGLVRDKRRLDDLSGDKQQESNSRSWSVGKELYHKRDHQKDAKFDHELYSRAYGNKDEHWGDDKFRSGDDKSSSVRSRGVRDGGEGRIYSKDDDPHREIRWNNRDSEEYRGGRRHVRDEEEHRGRKHRRDEEEEEDYKYRRHGKDDGKQHGRGKEEERGNKGYARERQTDYSKKARYDDSLSSERKPYEKDKRDGDGARR